MTDDKPRDELVEQGIETVKAAHLGLGYHTDVTALVDAGWRPPPSGDVIEQVARTLRATPADFPGSEREQEWSTYMAQALADAGLLAQPMQVATDND